MPEDVNVVQKQETTEVLDLGGKTAEKSPISGIFDALAAGKAEGQSNKEILKEYASKNQEKKPEPVEKKETPAPEKKETDLDKKLKDKPEVKEEVKEDDDPRKALQKAFDKRQAEKKAEADPEKKEEDVSEDELKPLPTDKPKTVKRIQALLKKVQDTSSEAAKTKAERDEKASKLAELEKELATVRSSNPATDEKVKKQLDELAMYRRRYELDADPDIKSKYDGRVQAAEETIIATLKRRNVGDGLLNLIKDEGGWSSFANSARLVAIPDGEGGTRQITSAELAELILQKLPLGERKAVEAAMVDQANTKSEKDRFFKEEQAKANEFFSKRAEEAKKQSDEQQKAVAAATKAVDEWRAKVEASDWIKDKEVPANATAEQKAAIAEHNRYNGQLRSFLKKALETKDLNGMLEVVEDSVRYYDERRTTAALKNEVESLKAQLKAKEDEFSKYKNGGRSVPKSGSIAVTSSPESSRERAPANIAQAFDLIAQRKARGETLLVNDE